MDAASPHLATRPPIPLHAEDALRWEVTRKRRRLLGSQHQQDLDALLRQQLGNVRRSAWGQPDLTANPFLALWTQVAALYAEAPEVTVEGGNALAKAVEASGYWAMMHRIQRDTLALREMLVRVDATQDGEAVHRPVYPDMVTAEVDRSRPWMMTRIREAICMPDVGWTWHDLSIVGDGAPWYRVHRADGGADITEDVLGARHEGAAYPYRTGVGTPVLPYVVYHAARTGYLWDPHALQEIVDGSLNLGVLLTYYGHIIRNAAWAQRYVAGAQPAGAEPVGDTDGNSAARREVVTDPATLLVLEPIDSGGAAGQVLVGQWSTPVDPEVVLRSILQYERRLLLLAGFQPPDVTRQEADIRSGYSLAVDRERVREQQRVYEPQFRVADTELIRLSAVVLNSRAASRGEDRAHPEDPAAVHIRYRGLPPSPLEMRAKREELVALVSAGLMDMIEAYRQLHPEVTPDEAAVALERIRQTNARFGAPGTLRAA